MSRGNVKMGDSGRTEHRTVYSVYMKPVIEYVIGLGEALALAVLFRFAAVKTDSLLIDVLSFLISCAVGAYAGLPLGVIMGPLNRIKTKNIWVALAICAPLAIVVVAIVQVITKQIGIAVDQMMKAGLAT